MSSGLFSPEMLFNIVCDFCQQVSEMAVSELPGNPNAVWTVKRHIEGEIDICTVLSSLPDAVHWRCSGQEYDFFSEKYSKQSF